MRHSVRSGARRRDLALSLARVRRAFTSCQMLCLSTRQSDLVGGARRIDDSWHYLTGELRSETATRVSFVSFVHAFSNVELRQSFLLGKRFLPTWLSSVVLRLDASRLILPEPA
jgi:hypothetical protein